jgi:phosphoserine phosphatase
MGGGVSFREALRARLDIIRPSRAQVSDFLVQRPPVLTPGVEYALALAPPPRLA